MTHCSSSLQRTSKTSKTVRVSISSMIWRKKMSHGDREWESTKQWVHKFQSLELRQYKNDSIWSRDKLALNLPGYFVCLYGLWKKAAISKLICLRTKWCRSYYVFALGKRILKIIMLYFITYLHYALHLEVAFHCSMLFIDFSLNRIHNFFSRLLRDLNFWKLLINN